MNECILHELRWLQTAIVEGLAQRMVQRDVPDSLLNVKVGILCCTFLLQFSRASQQDAPGSLLDVEVGITHFNFSIQCRAVQQAAPDSLLDVMVGFLHSVLSIEYEA